MPTSLDSKSLCYSTLTVALVLGALSSLCGLNHDQAIFLQAGLREVFGQGVYQDYFVPQGAVAGKVLALFLRLSPTPGWGMVAASMALNAGATWLGWELILMASGSVPHAFLGSLLTGIWFLPVFGSFYNDHLSYFFLLVALYLYLKLPRRYQDLSSTFFLALSYHTKQSVGITGLGAWLVTMLWLEGKKRTGKSWGIFGAYYFTAHLLLLWNSQAYTQWKNYLLYAVQCPLWYASSAKPPGRLLQSLVMPWNINPYAMVTELGAGRTLFYPLVIAIYVAYYALAKAKRREGTNPNFAFILGFVLLSTLWGSALLGRYHGQLFFAAGIIIALASFELAIHVVPVLILYSALGLINIYSGRGLFAHANSELRESALYPIRIEKNPVSVATGSMLAYLKGHPGITAAIGVRTYLIGPALGKALVNPSLYYQKELTIPWKHPEREEWIQTLIESLESKHAQYLVVDEIWKNRNQIYLPELIRYLDENYQVRISHPPLQIWERQAARTLLN